MATIELSEFTARAMKRISPIYEQSDFIKNFYNGVGVKFDLLREYFKTFSDQSFIDTVDWAIAVQEMKYSLDVRPDLTLEQRRSRLGIKARTHRPLNPARMEKYIREHFDTETYLYEKEAGVIRIYTERFTASGYKKIIDWLSVEKPSHLSLAIYLNMTEYLGSGEYAGNASLNPAIAIDLPKTIAAKKKYPRMFAGVGQIITGIKEIGLPEPETDSQAEILAGVAQSCSGEITIAPKQLKHSQMILRAGTCMQLVGGIWIDSYEKPTLPYYPFRLEPPYEPNESYNFYYDMIDKAGIYLREEEQEENSLRLMTKARPLKAASTEYYNDVTFIPEDKLPQEFAWRDIVENPYGDLAKGSLAVARGWYSFENVVIDTDEWDIVKIFFGFPTSKHRRYRGVAMKNPRADLTREEIKETGQYAVDNELLKNERGEIANKVLGAAYKRREVTPLKLGG